ncbi:ATPase involved in DNA replication initiation [Caulobacter sp. AP07]|uniref:helix-turn-helix domain-containing protein n=1 Tax=Caulobacter sp. AP07 TaxID=1144304 RepID=UPI0002721ACF|nr:helix-turn-helix domain-containing protein [Caulobacter sp. AP07]EJL36571.1 ATPase involved in DNA replication initiation [Caulobacter sp. AP07]
MTSTPEPHYTQGSETGATIPPSALRIVEEVAAKHGQTAEAMLSKSQTPDLTAARREVYARLMRRHSSQSIGAWMNRHHHNVIKGAKAYRDLMAIPDAKARHQSFAAPKTALSLWRGVVTVPQPRRPMKDIAEEVAFAHGVTVADLVGPSQLRIHAHSRQHAMYVMAQQTHLSNGMIGKFLGGRDQSTVHHGIRAHAARIAAEWSGRAAA